MKRQTDRHVWTRLTAVGFALGGAVHLAALALLTGGIEVYGQGYPAWRHLVMAATDWFIAWIAVARTRMLIVALLLFGVEQVAVNGVEPITVLVFVAALAAAWEYRAAGQTL